MDKDTILYALSTLAQTCAALAAFIGAIGLYRLQSLKQRRSDIYNNIWNAYGRPTQTSDQTLGRAKEDTDVQITDNSTLLDVP